MKGRYQEALTVMTQMAKMNGKTLPPDDQVLSAMKLIGQRVSVFGNDNTINDRNINYNTIDNNINNYSNDNCFNDNNNNNNNNYIVFIMMITIMIIIIMMMMVRRPFLALLRKIGVYQAVQSTVLCTFLCRTLCTVSPPCSSDP